MYKAILLVICILLIIFLSSCGKHYDCYNWGIYPKEELLEVIEYCKSDRMYQYNSCGSGKRDWKDGVCR